MSIGPGGFFQKQFFNRMISQKLLMNFILIFCVPLIACLRHLKYKKDIFDNKFLKDIFLETFDKFPIYDVILYNKQ